MRCRGRALLPPVRGLSDARPQTYPQVSPHVTAKQADSGTTVPVAVPVPLPRTFSYRLAEGQRAAPGCRVRVPFGRRSLVGIVWPHTVAPTSHAGELRTVTEVIDNAPLLSGSRRLR